MLEELSAGPRSTSFQGFQQSFLGGRAPCPQYVKRCRAASGFLAAAGWRCTHRQQSWRAPLLAQACRGSGSQPVDKPGQSAAKQVEDDEGEGRAGSRRGTPIHQEHAAAPAEPGSKSRIYLTAELLLGLPLEEMEARLTNRWTGMKEASKIDWNQRMAKQRISKYALELGSTGGTPPDVPQRLLAVDRAAAAALQAAAAHAEGGPGQAAGQEAADNAGAPAEPPRGQGSAAEQRNQSFRDTTGVFVRSKTAYITRELLSLPPEELSERLVQDLDSHCQNIHAVRHHLVVAARVLQELCVEGVLDAGGVAAREEALQAAGRTGRARATARELMTTELLTQWPPERLAEGMKAVWASRGKSTVQLFAAVAEEELHRLAASGELPPDRLTRQLEAVRRLVQQRLKTKKEDSPTSAGDSVTAPDQKGPRRTTLYITNDFLLQPAPELEAAVLHELDSRCATSDTAWYHISVARERLTELKLEGSLSEGECSLRLEALRRASRAAASRAAARELLTPELLTLWPPEELASGLVALWSRRWPSVVKVHAAVAEQELNRLAASGELPSDRLPGQLEAVRTAREECTSLQQQWLRTVATLEPEAIRESLLADWAGKSATSVYAMARSLERILEAMEANGQLDGGALVARMAAVAAARAEVLTEPQIPSGPNEQENRRIGRAAYITPALVLEPPDVVRRTLEEALRGRNGTAAAMHCRRLREVAAAVHESGQMSEEHLNAILQVSQEVRTSVGTIPRDPAILAPAVSYLTDEFLSQPHQQLQAQLMERWEGRTRDSIRYHTKVAVRRVQQVLGGVEEQGMDGGSAHGLEPSDQHGASRLQLALRAVDAASRAATEEYRRRNQQRLAGPPSEEGEGGGYRGSGVDGGDSGVDSDGLQYSGGDSSGDDLNEADGGSDDDGSSYSALGLGLGLGGEGQLPQLIGRLGLDPALAARVESVPVQLKHPLVQHVLRPDLPAAQRTAALAELQLAKTPSQRKRLLRAVRFRLRSLLAQGLLSAERAEEGERILRGSTVTLQLWGNPLMAGVLLRPEAEMGDGAATEALVQEWLPVPRSLRNSTIQNMRRNLQRAVDVGLLTEVQRLRREVLIKRAALQITYLQRGMSSQQAAAAADLATQLPGQALVAEPASGAGTGAAVGEQQPVDKLAVVSVGSVSARGLDVGDSAFWRRVAAEAESGGWGETQLLEQWMPLGPLARKSLRQRMARRVERLRAAAELSDDEAAVALQLLRRLALSLAAEWQEKSRSAAAEVAAEPPPTSDGTTSGEESDTESLTGVPTVLLVRRLASLSPEALEQQLAPLLPEEKGKRAYMVEKLREQLRHRLEAGLVSQEELGRQLAAVGRAVRLRKGAGASSISSAGRPLLTSSSNQDPNVAASLALIAKGSLLRPASELEPLLEAAWAQLDSATVSNHVRLALGRLRGLASSGQLSPGARQEVVDMMARVRTRRKLARGPPVDQAAVEESNRLREPAQLLRAPGTVEEELFAAWMALDPRTAHNHVSYTRKAVHALLAQGDIDRLGHEQLLVVVDRAARRWRALSDFDLLTPPGAGAPRTEGRASREQQQPVATGLLRDVRMRLVHEYIADPAQLARCATAVPIVPSRPLGGLRQGGGVDNFGVTAEEALRRWALLSSYAFVRAVRVSLERLEARYQEGHLSSEQHEAAHQELQLWRQEAVYLRRQIALLQLPPVASANDNASVDEVKAPKADGEQGQVRRLSREQQELFRRALLGRLLEAGLDLSEPGPDEGAGAGGRQRSPRTMPGYAGRVAAGRAAEERMDDAAQENLRTCLEVSPSALDLLSPPDELRSWMPQHLQVKLHQFVQEHLASSGAQRKGAKLNQEQGSPGREDTQAPVVQSADLTRTKTNAVHTIRNRLQQLLKWGIIGPALHARQLAAVNDVSSSWSYSSAGGPLEADALVVKGAPGRRNTEELRRALLEKGPRELQAWLTERWRSKHGPGKEAEQLMRQLQALQSVGALGSQQCAGLRAAVRVLVEHWEKVEKGSMSMGQVNRVRPRQRGRPAAPDTIAPAVVVASTRSARGRTQDDSSRARARGEASKGTTRNSSVGSTAAKPAGRSSAQERRTSRAAMPAASAMEPHAPADTVDVEFSTVSEHAAAPTAEQPEQPAMTGVGAAHAAPRLTEPQPVPAAHVGTASTAPGSLPPATVSDELVVKVQRLQALVTQQRAALAALERRATEDGGAMDGASPLAASIAQNRQLLKQVEARLEEWASSLPAAVRQRLGLQAGSGASPTVRETASAVPDMQAPHSNATLPEAPASAVGSLEAGAGLLTGGSLHVPQTPLANGTAYSGRTSQVVVVNATVPEGGASAQAERPLPELGGHNNGEDDGATYELPSSQHGQAEGGAAASLSSSSSSSSSPQEGTDASSSKLSWVEQAKTRVLQRVAPVPKGEPAGKSRSRTPQPATALPSGDEAVVQEPSSSSDGATEDQSRVGVVSPPAGQPQAPAAAAPAPDVRQLSSKFFSKAPPVRPFSARTSQDQQDG